MSDALTRRVQEVLHDIKVETDAGMTVSHHTHDHVEIIMSEEQHEAVKKLLEAQQAGRSETFVQHVKACDECVVTDDGSIWACKVGSAIRQRERKARL